MSTSLVLIAQVVFLLHRGHTPGPKNPFLCPDGRVATGQGRLAQ